MPMKRIMRCLVRVVAVVAVLALCGCATHPPPTLPPDMADAQFVQRVFTRTEQPIESRVSVSPGVPESWWRVFGRIEPGPFHGGYNEREGESLDPELVQFLETRFFEEWSVYEDDLVRLVYPEHPALKLEIRGPDAGIKVEGGVVSTGDNSFARAYVLTADRFTYGAFLLTAADWLDDGVCLCGPMIHHVYRERNGCLVRFSLLPGGAAKKAQTLGGGLRLMAFEWTHLACPREVYEQMVERMQLRIPGGMDAAAMRAEVGRRYGKYGLSGWLHPGMAIAVAEEIMGSESIALPTGRRWEFVAGKSLWALEVEVHDGRITAVRYPGPTRVSRLTEPGRS